MTALVADASAILAAIRDGGPAGESARARIAASDLHGPDHLPIEVVSVFARWRAGGMIRASAAEEALNVFWSIPVRLWRLDIVRDRVWELTAHLSGYDAAYVALAERLGAPLLTADRRIARAPAASPVAIELIG